jgi:hypothetical protein
MTIEGGTAIVLAYVSLESNLILFAPHPQASVSTMQSSILVI